MTARNLAASLIVTGMAVAASAAAAPPQRSAGSASSHRQAPAPRFNLQLTVEHLSLDEMERLVPALQDLELPPGFRVAEFEASGPLEKLHIIFRVESTRSNVKGDLVADLAAPARSVQGTVDLDHVNLAEILKRPPLPSEVTGTARFALRFGEPAGMAGLSGTYEIQASSLALQEYRASSIRLTGSLERGRLSVDARATAYGAALNATAEVTLPAGSATVAYQMRGRVRQLDLARLPRQLGIPVVPSDLDLTYQVAGGAEEPLSIDAEFQASPIGTARLAAGSSAHITVPASGPPRYRARGSLTGLDPQEIGRTLEVDALQRDDYQGRVDARISVEGRGAWPDMAALHVADSQLFGGRIPSLDVTARIEEDVLHVQAEGEVAGIRPPVSVLAERGGAAITGRFNVSGTLTDPRHGFALDNLSVDGRLDLTSADVAGVHLDSGLARGGLANGQLQLRDLTLSGPDLHVHASGTMALDHAGESSLTYALDSPAAGSLASRFAVPVTGAVKIDGTLSGNLDSLRVKGAVSGRDVAYASVAVSTVSATYDATLPPAQPSAAHVQVTTDARGIAAGGRTIERVAAETTYADSRLDVDVHATQSAARTATAGGTLLWDANGQTLRLHNLTLVTPAVTWQLTPGSSPVIERTGDTIDVADLRFEAAPDQRISVGGALSDDPERPPLDVAGVNLRLSDIVTLVDPGWRVTGTLDLDGRVRGNAGAPRGTFRWTLRDGTAGPMALQAFTGGATYDGRVAIVDARLTQAPGAWLTAKGRVPVAGLTGTTGPAGTGDDTWDLAVQSGPLPLDLVQPLTQAVSRLGGHARLDVTLVGPPRAPRVLGRASVQDGALTVTATGSRYRGLTADLRLEGDSVRVAALEARDEDNHTLSATGQAPLALSDGGRLDLRVSGRGFEVLNNDLGSLRIDADLGVDGALAAPAVHGTLAVDGSLQVDQLVQFAGAGAEKAYAVEGVRISGEQPIAVRPAKEEGLLRDVPVALDVQLTVPPRFLLRGKDIRTGAGTPIGLGDVNIAVGGNLHLTKTPHGPLRLAGDVTTVRGTYSFQGREFQIQRNGRIRFEGLAAINPSLDVTADRDISGVLAKVHIGGALGAPTLDLSSEPPLDRADIFSLIVFNRPAGQLGAAEEVSLSQRAGAFVTGFIGSKIADTVGSALHLDLVDIQTGQAASGLAPTVTIGEQFGNLYFKLRQGFGPESASQVLIEYQITDWVRLQTSVSNGTSTTQSLFRRTERAGIDAIFFFSY